MEFLKEAFVFRVGAGEATDPKTGEKFELSVSVGSSSPIIGFEDGSFVTWTWTELLTAAVKFKAEEEAKTEDGGIECRSTTI